LKKLGLFTDVLFDSLLKRGTNYICTKNHLMGWVKMIAAQNPIVFSTSGGPILKKTGNPPIPDSG
jgi:hypothetical protein